MEAFIRQALIWQVLRSRVRRSRAKVRGYELVETRAGRWLDSFPEDEDLLVVAAQAQEFANDYEAPVEVWFNGRYVGTVYPAEEVPDELSEEGVCA